jgi:quinol monooxygenase YgiN
MTYVAQVITVPKQPQLSAAELELARQKSQAALDRSKGVEGWLGSVTLASAGVPTMALTFWRDAAACQANMDAHPDAIDHARKHGLLDQVAIHDVTSAAMNPAAGEEAAIAQVFRLPAVGTQLTGEQQEEMHKVAQDALDRQRAVDGCVGALIVGGEGEALMAVNFWRDEAALQAATAQQAAEIAAARQANPQLQINDPEILEVFASARP